MALKLNSDPRHAQADVPPASIRSALQLALLRGHSAERLCRGLGFLPIDLCDAAMRVSYRQASLFIRRFCQALGDPAVGLACGARQTPLSMGLPGLGMLTCRTFGEAILYAAEHQRDAGALLHHQHRREGAVFVLEATPRFFEPDLQPYLVEEAFACDVSIMRWLIGAQANPLRVELAYLRPAHASSYDAFFKCPVHFGRASNRVFTDASCLEYSLPTYEEFTSPYLQGQLESLMPRREGRDDLLESVATHLRANLEEPSALKAAAEELNISERTLRRRLSALDVSYRDLLDQARHERAIDLLRRTSMTLGEVAIATGFSDVRNFRRAFKRWTGQLPSDVRHGAG